MKNILIVGSNGMLGTDLVKVFSRDNYHVTAATRKDFDITKRNEVENFFKDKSFDLVINSAAYTQVDKAETEQELAFLVNETGAKNLSQVTNKKNIPIIYISTDYVFDGTKEEPYKTTDQTNPINIYGKSKLAGEIATQKYNPNSYIVRTSWLFGKNGKNFVNTMLELAKTHKEIKIVNDQYGCPTSTIELSNAIKELVENNSEFGIFHICGDKSMSWYEFAQEIFKDNNIDVKVIAISSEEFPRPAKRPGNSILNNDLNL